MKDEDQAIVRASITTIAERLSSYPVLFIMVILMGLISGYVWWVSFTSEAVVEKLVFAEIEHLWRITDELKKELNECYTQQRKIFQENLHHHE